MVKGLERLGRLMLVLGLLLTGGGLGRAAVLAAPTPVAPSQPTPDWQAPHVPGQLIVKLAGAPEISRQRLVSAGVQVLRVVPAQGLALLDVSPAILGRAGAGSVSLAEQAAVLAALGAVEWAEPNYTFGLDLAPNDPFYPSPQSAYLARLEMPAAWDRTIGRPEIVIAILDTGVDMAHDDLRKGIWTNPREIPGNGLDDDGNGFADDVHGWDFADNDNVPDDDYGHGTHVAGIAAARINNNVGIAGMAGGATIMSVDVFPRTGYGTYMDLIQALFYATDNGAQVINMSLGATSYSLGEEMAVDYAWSHGVVVVAAAGNTGRASYHYPAAHRNAIAVASTDASDNLSGFSTRGDWVDVAAPGSSVYSTYRGNRYAAMSGTSMATPHVAGLAALLLSLNPKLTPDEVRAAIQNTAEDLGAPGRDDSFGYGRINARRALAAVVADPPLPEWTPGPPLPLWPAGCQELTLNGGFETGLTGWQSSGAVAVDASRVYSGALAAHFVGAPGARAALTQTFTLPTFAAEATLWFAYRIENDDFGWGTTPQRPFDDWFTADFRTPAGEQISNLLFTGNSADTATDGLPWDRYVYRLQLSDTAPLRAHPQVSLVFNAANDGDNLPTDFWVDQVLFCVKQGARYTFPLMIRSGGAEPPYPW